MEHYAGIDVSLERSSVCVVDAQGKIVKEAKIASEPEAAVAFFETLGIAVKRIGLASPDRWFRSLLASAQACNRCDNGPASWRYQHSPPVKSPFGGRAC
jgi:hypothetical protein